MSLILIYIAIVFTAVALVLTLLPLFGSRRERVRVEFIEEELRMIEGLAARRAALLQQLRDLEFDRETDKVSEEDYARFKRRYELEAVGVMRKLDEIRGGQNWDRLVDQAIADHRGEPLPAQDEAPDENDEVESPVADETEDTNDTGELEADSDLTHDAPTDDTADRVEDSDDDADLHCGSCGESLDPDDRFCRNCGASTPSSQDATEASA